MATIRKKRTRRVSPRQEVDLKALPLALRTFLADLIEDDNLVLTQQTPKLGKMGKCLRHVVDGDGRFVIRELMLDKQSSDEILLLHGASTVAGLTYTVKARFHLHAGRLTDFQIFGRPEQPFSLRQLLQLPGVADLSPRKAFWVVSSRADVITEDEFELDEEGFSEGYTIVGYDFGEPVHADFKAAWRIPRVPVVGAGSLQKPP